ncbi:MAG TPA: hypothetical protein VKB86_09290 [Pyrinomonadaceae bacterium]|nr:hypothetical protein [Pyrinomonadaceae bacterium]
MKQAFRLSCAVALFLLLAGASHSIQAQTTPDPFITQITSSAKNSFAGDMSGDGRFVVIESTGDISTERTDARNNADGNREIFLFDYAQRKIFQITNTTSARVDTTKPALSTTSDTDFSNVKVEVSNNHPVISNNGRWIAFSSNAVLTTASRGTFDGDANSAALAADGNQEIYIYFIPPTTSVNLSNGADAPGQDLTLGEFTQITNTPASHLPVAGTSTSTPFVAFDNRDPSVSDSAAIVSFVSTRDLVTGGNADANPEIYIFKRNTASPLTGVVTQLTNTTGLFTFNENPSVSGSGAAIAFISNANITVGGSGNNSDANSEVYLGSINTSTGAGTVTRQVTNTKAPASGIGVNFFSPGRRISRDGNFIALESLADLSGDNSIKAQTTVFVYNVSSNAFTQIGPRADNTSQFRFPTFTDYNSSLQPATVIFSSGLNFTSTGTVPSTASDGLNPSGATQIFAAPLGTSSITFTRLTNNPGSPGPAIQPFPSNTQQRIAFSITGTELGGLNIDLLSEAFYLLSRQGTDASGATLSFFTGASERPIVTPSPTPPAVATLAPGELTIVRSATALAPSGQNANTASESKERPSLPVELNGVSISVNGAAAGLVFVSTGQINFVVPPGLAPTTGTATYPVVINNNGTTIRSTLQISIAQPDIFTQSNQFGSNRAIVLNVTNPLPIAGSPEPFTVTTTYVDSTGQIVTAPTILRIFLTGVRRITDPSQVKVTIGTTDIVGTTTATTSPIAISPTDTPGTDQIDVTLPASLAGAGDVPVIVTITNGGATFTSRASDTAPKIRIN